MTQDEALEKLELEVGASQQEIQQQYQEFYNEFQMRITNAPTTHQKNLYQKKFKQLEEAFKVLTGQETENLDVDLPWSSPGQVLAKVQNDNIQQPGNREQTKEQALKLLGLQESFTNTQLKYSYTKKRNDLQKGINEAFNNTIKQAYSSSLNEIEEAYLILVPFGQINVHKHFEPKKAKVKYKNNDNRNILILVGVLLIVGLLLIIKPWDEEASFFKPEKVDNSISKFSNGLEAVRNIEENLIFVKGGEYNMGCTNPKDKCNADEFPKHQVKLNSFNIGKYEITQAHWIAIMGDNPSYFKDCIDCPVEQVSWLDIQIFLKKINKLSKKKYRLPTEAEWEYVARGGTQQKNFIYSGGNILKKVGWYGENSFNRTHSVGQKQPNSLGVYDMSGNVLEWCNDVYKKSYYANSPKKDPKGPAYGTFKSTRGGGFIFKEKYGRLVNRNGSKPSNKKNYLGFRIICEI